MIELRIDTKGKPLKNQSIKISEDLLEMTDSLISSIKTISKSYDLKYIPSKPEILRILIEESIKNNVSILSIEDKVLSIKEILKLYIGEFEYIENIIDIFPSIKELKKYLIDMSIEAINSMHDDINNVDTDDIEEEEINNYVDALSSANHIFNEEENDFYGDIEIKGVDNKIRSIAEYQELVDDYGLVIDDFIDYLQLEFEYNREYKILNALYYYKPSAYAKCRNQLDIILSEWTKYCLSYSEVYTSNVQVVCTLDNFVKNVEKKIGLKFKED